MNAVAAGNKSLLAFDSVFPHRDDVLCTDTMRARFAVRLRKQIDSCEIARVKYRPGVSLRVLYRLKIENEILLITARVFSETGRRKVFEKEDQAIFYDQKLNTVFWKFPFDRKIRQLYTIQTVVPDCENFKGEIRHKSELVAYAPEKCATFKYSNQENEIFAYAKVFADDADAARIFSIYKGLPNEGHKLFPQILCYSAKYNTLFVEAVKGVRLDDLKGDNLLEAYSLFGTAIARFHELETAETLNEFSRHSPAKISETLKIIKQALPEHFKEAENLARKLEEKFDFEDEEKVTLHGDVHAKNAILEARGSLTLIDLDQVSAGYASSDIGSFLAGLFYKQITGEISAEKRIKLSGNFFAGYKKVGPLPGKKSLCRHTAAAIFTERCGRAINRFRVEGLKNFAEILISAKEILEGKYFEKL